MRRALLNKLLAEELREHLTTGRPPRLPAGGGLIWRWFIDLHRTRAQSLAGPLPITHVEIVAYAALTRWSIRPDHVVSIMNLDAAYRSHANGVAVEHSGPSSEVVLTAAAFDAIMG